MTQRDNILHELKELESKLANASPLNVYSIPVGYFEELAANILSRIKAMGSDALHDEMKFLSPFISNIPPVNPYSVPVGYFEKLEDTLMGVIRNTEEDQTPQEELEDLSPLLSSLNKQIPYKVPERYFDSLNSAVSKKITSSEAKVISLSSRKWFRYAAAAVIVGFIALGGLLFLYKKETIDPSDKSFAWVEKSMKKVSTDEIDEFIDMTDKMAPVIASNGEKNDVKELIKNISDKEIQDFLNDAEAAEPDDAADNDIFLN